jgi:nucleoside-diphosphate-sugar epimerase
VERVVVTGAAGAIGRRVVHLLVDAPDVEHVLALDRRPVNARDPKVEHRTVDLRRAEALADPAVLAGTDTIIHLPFAASAIRRRPGVLETEVTRNLLAAASAADVRHLVVLSTATVYGAWPNNPVPITEDAPLRPAPDFAYAVGHAEVEQLVVDWAEDAPGRTVAVLRPVTGLAEDGSSWLARALAGAAGVLGPEEDPPAQFVHLDDLAAAVDLVRRKRLDGTYNVSPDGWIAGPRLRALAGSKPRVRPPAWVTHWVGHLRWRFQRGPIPPGLRPYTMHAWLVANDRLKAEGWRPKVTNEQAFVAGTENRWWQLLTPKRRQELALGLAGVLAAAGVATAVLLVRRAVRAARAARDAARELP